MENIERSPHLMQALLAKIMEDARQPGRHSAAALEKLAEDLESVAGAIEDEVAELDDILRKLDPASEPAH